MWVYKHLFEFPYFQLFGVYGLHVTLISSTKMPSSIREDCSLNLACILERAVISLVRKEVGRGLISIS